MEERPEGYDYESIPPCKNCGSENYDTIYRGPHLKASCTDCGRHIKFVKKLANKNEPDEYEEPPVTYCRICLRKYCETDRESWPERHHVIEQDVGGPDVEYNIMRLCVQCHRLVHSVRHYSMTNNTDPRTEEDKVWEKEKGR